MTPNVLSRIKMSVGRTIRSVFQALTKMHFARTYEKISITDRLYLGIPKMEIALVSNLGGETESAKISVDEARQILRSIKRACDSNDVVKIKVGELTWETDARLGSKDPEEMIIKFNGPYTGYTRTPAKRKDVVAAMTEFANRFGAD